MFAKNQTITADLVNAIQVAIAKNHVDQIWYFNNHSPRYSIVIKTTVHRSQRKRTKCPFRSWRGGRLKIEVERGHVIAYPCVIFDNSQNRIFPLKEIEGSLMNRKRGLLRSPVAFTLYF